MKNNVGKESYVGSYGDSVAAACRIARSQWVQEGLQDYLWVFHFGGVCFQTLFMKRCKQLGKRWSLGCYIGVWTPPFALPYRRRLGSQLFIFLSSNNTSSSQGLGCCPTLLSHMIFSVKQKKLKSLVNGAYTIYFLFPSPLFQGVGGADCKLPT